MKTKINILDNLSIDRWEEYRDLYIEAVRNEPLAFSETVTEAEKNTEEDWKKGLSDAINQRTVLVFAECNNKIIGMGAGSFHKLEKLSHNAFISSLYVSAEFRGQGIGKKIIEEIIALLLKNKSVSNIFSEIIETQTTSIELHTKLGFEVVGKFESLFRVNGRLYNEVYLQKKV